MRNIIPLFATDLSAKASAPTRRSIAELLAPLDQLAADSPNFIVNKTRSELEGDEYHLPRYTFVGPRGGDVPVRLGIFAGIHGDEPESTHAAIRFLKFLEQHPNLAEGFCISVYPLCNPTGFEDNTRHSRRRKDLNREFWKNSREPEVNFLEAELVSGSFQGLISLHIDNTCDGFYGIVGGATLTRHLLQPALVAAERFLPLDKRTVIEGFAAKNSILRESFGGVLSAPPLNQQRPFEIVLEAPNHFPAHLAEWGFLAALESILSSYRKLMAYAPNL